MERDLIIDDRLSVQRFQEDYYLVSTAEVRQVVVPGCLERVLYDVVDGKLDPLLLCYDARGRWEVSRTGSGYEVHRDTLHHHQSMYWNTAEAAIDYVIRYLRAGPPKRVFCNC